MITTKELNDILNPPHRPVIIYTLITKSSKPEKPYCAVAVSNIGYCFPSEVFVTREEAVLYLTQILKPQYAEYDNNPHYELIEAPDESHEGYAEAWKKSQELSDIIEEFFDVTDPEFPIKNPPSYLSHLWWRIKWFYTNELLLKYRIKYAIYWIKHQLDL